MRRVVRGYYAVIRREGGGDDGGGRYMPGCGASEAHTVVRWGGERLRNEVICERCNKGPTGGRQRKVGKGEGRDYMRVQEEIDRDGDARESGQCNTANAGGARRRRGRRTQKTDARYRE